MTREHNHGKSGLIPLFLLRKPKRKRILFRILCFVVFALSVVWLLGYGIYCLWQNMSIRNTQKELRDIREEADTPPQYEIQFDENGLPIAGVAAVFADIYKDTEAGEESSKIPEILPKYKKLYELNPDLIGWLSIDDTVIDYPVMQTMEDECYYLRLDFYGEPNQNGCLILDTDSTAGTGTKACDYANGTAPSTNLIIHGHTMKSGQLLELLYNLAEKKGAIPAQISLAWMLCKKPFIILIPGNRKTERLKENFDAMYVSLIEKEIADIDKKLDAMNIPVFGGH